MCSCGYCIFGIIHIISNFCTTSLMIFQNSKSKRNYYLFMEYEKLRHSQREDAEKIAAEIGKHPSTASREYQRNVTARGSYNDSKAQAMAVTRRKQGKLHNNTPPAAMAHRAKISIFCIFLGPWGLATTGWGVEDG